MREGGEEKLPCGGRAWPAGHRGQPGRASAMEGKEALRAWVAKEGVADMETLEVFNKVVTRRTPADLSSTEHLTVLNKKLYMRSEKNGYEEKHEMARRRIWSYLYNRRS